MADPLTYLEVLQGVTLEAALQKAAEIQAETKRQAAKKREKEQLKVYRKENGKSWWDLGTCMISGCKIRKSTKLKRMNCSHTGTSLTMASYLELKKASGRKRPKCPMCQTPIPRD